MFESDDFDQVLSQFDFTEVVPAKQQEKENIVSPDPNDTREPQTPEDKSTVLITTKTIPQKQNIEVAGGIPKQKNKDGIFVSPKHTKRKIISSYFDHKNKRKFPGPAGLLTGVFQEPKDDSICHMELLSQDIDCTQHNLERHLFESPLWKRLLSDIDDWKLDDIDSIKAIKQQALAGNLRRQKAQIVTAFIDAVDRSAIDPLIKLRDTTGTIKCTLHRDAWATFSSYIVSEYCALVLQKPTVLTTGGAFKKHYLNITLSNILAIYSSTVLNEDGNKTLPEGYTVVYEDDFTVIKTEKGPDVLGTCSEQSNVDEDVYGDLDSFFSDDIILN